MITPSNYWRHAIAQLHTDERRPYRAPRGTDPVRGLTRSACAWQRALIRTSTARTDPYHTPRSQPRKANL
jgi:hypothetical protein